MIDGKIKSKPEDFIVEEVIFGKRCKIGYNIFEKIEDLIPKERKQFLHFTLVKRNWSIYEAISEISKRLRISKNRFGYAGMKDKNAITAQRISIFNVDIKELKKLKIRDIIIKNFEYSNKRIRLGDHSGNYFKIRIRNIINSYEVKGRIEELKKGFKNYFGEQRFGRYRNNHLIGKYVIMNRFDKAIKQMFSFNDELQKDWGNWRKGLLNTPQRMIWERIVLEHLMYHKNDYFGAFMKIPKRMRRLYLNAYQSYVFNEVLKRYKNPPETLPLIGFEVKFDPITENFLEEEGLSKEDFKEMKMKDIQLRGRRRKTIVYPKDLKYRILKNDLIVEFFLEKGVYATVFLDLLLNQNTFK